MTWIYIPSIPSTFSPATADSSLDSDLPIQTPTSKRSPISNGRRIASKSSASVKSMDFSMTLPSGTISNHSTADPGVERWISLLRDSHANHTATPASAKAPQMIETFFPIHSESLGKWDQESSCWRTCQASMWDLMDGHHMGAPWSDSWPKQGMTRSGELFPLPPQERPICVEGGGLWPTPTSTERSGTNPNTGRGEGLSKTARMFPTPRAGKPTDEDEESTPPLALAARMLPTPTTQEIEHPDIDLDDTGRRKTKDGQNSHSVNLADTARMLPTPSAGGDSGEEDAIAMSGGSLNPDWVSWLMGLPIGWTSLEPLSQEEYDEWFQMQHDGTWWQEERGLPRIATGIPDRVNRLKCLGNGIVPASLALFLGGR
jgi:hypothetical protein